MKKITAIVFIATLLTACSTAPRKGGYYQDDGPHSSPLKDVATIANAIPRNEPPSKSGNSPYEVFGKTYQPLTSARNYNEKGVASWYGKKFHGKRTSSGEKYDMYAMTAAHKTLPLPSYVKVENLKNGKSVTVRVNDRGPFLHNRLIDLSYAAATKLGVVDTGTGLVQVSSISRDNTLVTAEPLPPSQHSLQAEAIETGVPQKINAKKTNDPRIFLQIGAFRQKQNAEDLQSRLHNSDMGNIFIQSEGVENSTIYRVRIGPLSNVTESDQLAEKARRYGIADAHIIIE